MDVKYVLSVIEELQEEWYKSPMSYYHRKKVDFNYQSYKRSAIKEIKIYLKEHKDEDAISAIWEFNHLVNCFACNASNENTNFMFSVYCDVSIDVLDVLLSMQ